MPSERFVFDKTNTYCISLHSHENRWNSMKQRFSVMNLEVTRFEACTEVDTSLNFANFLSTLQKCCAQSHVKLWKHILTTPCEYALIIEDDACFDKQWENKLHCFDVDKGWDAIFLNVSEPEANTFSWVKAEEQYLTGAYIISRQGLVNILEIFSAQIHAADYMTTRLQRMSNSYTYFPWLVIQDGKDSTIGSGVDEDHKKVVKCLSESNYSLDNYII